MSACFSVFVFVNGIYFHVCCYCLTQNLSFSILVFSSKFSSSFAFLSLCYLFIFLYLSFSCQSYCLLEYFSVSLFVFWVDMLWQRNNSFPRKIFFKIFLQDKCQKISPSLKNNRGVKQIIAHRLHFKCFPLCHSSECKLSHISTHCEKKYPIEEKQFLQCSSVSVKKSNFEVFVTYPECYHRLLQKV